MYTSDKERYNASEYFGGPDFASGHPFMRFQSNPAARQRGFTIIELMIVVMIIGILASVAVPAYRDYTVRAKLSSLVSSIAGAKAVIALCIQENGGDKTPCTHGTNGIPNYTTAGSPAPQFYDNCCININSGGIKLTSIRGVGDGVNGKKICFEPFTSAARVYWELRTDMTKSDNEMAYQYLFELNGERSASTTALASC